MFSKSTEYALRAVIYIAKYGNEEKKVSLDEISKAIDSPPSFTAKILQKITKKSKFLNSISGPHGGFFMSEKSKALPLEEVLKLLEEKDVLEKCILGLDDCSEENPCPLHMTYKDIKPNILEMFKGKSLSELVNEVSNKKLNLKGLDT